ncbi:MAG: hypothetical protein A2Z72_02970 [Omnitrophica bacterium RBG_13_46_9]|nr:MAG: hypothetical protein A2Z72_02970 [Omnitrophica bacterium RBG_13_46_9]
MPYKKIITLLLVLLLLTHVDSGAEIPSGTDSGGYSAFSAGKEFSSFITVFYISPRPDKVPEVLQHLMTSDTFKDAVVEKDGEFVLTQKAVLLVYVFARLAELYPQLLRDYERLFNSADLRGRTFLLTVFITCSDQSNRAFLKERTANLRSAEEKKTVDIILNKPPLTTAAIIKEVKSALELDCLWAEFLLTGEKEPVEKVIGVLARPDIFRTRLTTWLSGSSPSEENGKIKDILEKYWNIKVDLADKRIVAPADAAIDLDIHCGLILRNSTVNKKDLTKDFAELRKVIGLSDEDIFVLVMKSTAAWSLYSNARQHEKVREICSETVANQPPKVRFYLTQVLNIQSE